MGKILGDGDFRYEAMAEWESLPDGVRFIECPGVAVDSHDRVYVLTRNREYPLIVFTPGGDFLRSFGQGVFSELTHGISIGPDDSVYCADYGTHTVTKFTPDGELLMTIGTPGRPSKMWGGAPFNRPTHAVVSPSTAAIYVTDGYRNSRVHKYTSDGRSAPLVGGAGHRRRPVHGATQSGRRRRRAGLRRRQGVPSCPDLRCRREVHHDVEQHPYARRADHWARWERLHRRTAEHQPRRRSGVGPPGQRLQPPGELLARFGDPEEGEEPGRFIAPHGIAVDSKGDIYVSEVSFTVRGRHMDPPTEPKSLKKLRKL